MSWLAVRSGVAALPNGIGWSHIGVVGIVGGIGFTMALFIAQLAFPPGVLLETAKLAILCGSGMQASSRCSLATLSSNKIPDEIFMKSLFASPTSRSYKYVATR